MLQSVKDLCCLASKCEMLAQLCCYHFQAFAWVLRERFRNGRDRHGFSLLGRNGRLREEAEEKFVRERESEREREQTR